MTNVTDDLETLLRALATAEDPVGRAARDAIEALGKTLNNLTWPSPVEAESQASVATIERILGRLDAVLKQVVVDPMAQLLERFFAASPSAERYRSLAPVEPADLPQWLALVCRTLSEADAQRWVAELDTIGAEPIDRMPAPPAVPARRGYEDIAELVAEIHSLATSVAPLCYSLHDKSHASLADPGAASFYTGKLQQKLLAYIDSRPDELFERLCVLEEALRAVYPAEFMDEGSWWSGFVRRCDDVLAAHLTRIQGQRRIERYLPTGAYPPKWVMADGRNATSKQDDEKFSGDGSEPPRVLWVLRSAYLIDGRLKPGRVIYQD